MVLTMKGPLPKIAVALVAGCTAGAVAAVVVPAFAQGLPNGDGRDLVRAVCTSCHDLSPITGTGMSRRDWETVVQSMIDMGAALKAEEVTVIVNYLAASFPPKTKQ